MKHFYICILLSLRLYYTCSFLNNNYILSTRLASFHLFSSIPLRYNHIHLKEYPNDNYSHILGYNDPNHMPSRLQNITKFRIADVELAKKPIDALGCGIDRTFYISKDDLYEEIKEFDNKYSKPINIYDKIISSFPIMSIAAEFKKASPSKGDINLSLDPVVQCMEYADAGASIISVLTEFKHFKGTLQDLKKVRLETEKVYGINRPAILRKDFIIDKYQILEARANGADTVLLIVAILGVNQLLDLISFSRSLNMEPLVEVHTEEELDIAIQCNSKVIGINNRNLHTFQLDLMVTNRLVDRLKKKGINYKISNGIKPDVLVASLSGISSREDVKNYEQIGISNCLIGETLMKSSHPKLFIKQLLGLDENSPISYNTQLLIKTCGFTDPEHVKHALQSGTNLIGLIFVNKSKRFVNNEKAKEIVEITRKYGERNNAIKLNIPLSSDLSNQEWYNKCYDELVLITKRKPLTVGVFQDHTSEQIIDETGIDLVQLHGNESPDIVENIKAPCIKVISINQNIKDNSDLLADISNEILKWKSKAIAILVDSSTGGSGHSFDWNVINYFDIPIILAGGLTVDNVQSVRQFDNVIGVDVSSGIEINGIKNNELVSKFISKVRS